MRGPRSFDIEEEAKPSEAARPHAEPPRAPRTLDLPPAFEPAPDVEAQRLPPDAVEELASLDPPPPPPTARRFSFAKLLFGALSLLATLAIGVAIDRLIADLFARADWLGWIGLAVTLAIVVALLGIVAREAAGIWRLARIESLREEVDAARTATPTKARAVLDKVVALFADRAETSSGRRKLAELDGEVVDADDLLMLGERHLLGSLDAKARALVLGSAKRVSVVTAVSPRALIDIAFVLAENLRLIRQVADLYGGRPGTIGFWQLARRVVSHLAVTGSIAVGDGLLQQVVGHGLAARLSQRLGEGVVNGLLTARVGIAAIDVCRPMPFHALRRPGISDFVADLTRLGHNDAAHGEDGERKVRT